MYINNSSEERDQKGSIIINKGICFSRFGFPNNKDGFEFCICKKPCFGRMIECDQCYNWFYYDYVGIIEGKEPDEWVCNRCKHKYGPKFDKNKN